MHIVIRDRLQISLLVLTEFKWLNWLLFPLKSSENLGFLMIFMANRSFLIPLILEAKFGDDLKEQLNLNNR